MKPTVEQENAVELFKAGGSLKITAFAGAGKTSTLKMLASSVTRRGTYLAFNKKIATEAKGKFPSRVDCRTTHSMAFQAVVGDYRSPKKLTQSLFPKQLAAELDYKRRLFGPHLKLDPTQQAFLVLKTVANFCQSADARLSANHMPLYGALLGQPAHVLEEVRAWSLAQAISLWAQMTSKNLDIPLGHDGYLKVWALSEPRIASAYILLDEAQDTNPVVLGVLNNQSAQLVYVGDRHQQIYEWRGAVNAMQKINTDKSAHLTKSFRFGEAIAKPASDVLATLGETLRIQGNEAVQSNVKGAGQAGVILARTNATVISEVVEALNQGLATFIVGGTEELKRLVGDVFDLKKRQPAKSPELFGFTSWGEVVAFSETEEGESLQRFVQLVDKHGEKGLWRAVTSVEDEEDDADLIVSTAHKAKGCEWDDVRLANDFLSSRPASDKKTAAAETRLFYVAMTRAKRTLIVDPAILNMFKSGAWKTRTENRERPRSSASAGEPRSWTQQKPCAPSRAPIERISVAAQSSHPSFASSSENIHRTAPRPDPQRGPAKHSASGSVGSPIERISRTAQSSHPAFASPPGDNSDGQPGAGHSPGKASWGQRMARFFTGK